MALTEEQKERRRANLAKAREAKKARAPAETPASVVARPTAVDTASPPVTIQMGPTPGYMFAVFRDNPEYHQLPVELWDAAAKLALQRRIAILGADLIGDLHKEPLRPFNWMCEFRGGAR